MFNNPDRHRYIIITPHPAAAMSGGNRRNLDRAIGCVMGCATGSSYTITLHGSMVPILPPARSALNVHRGAEDAIGAEINARFLFHGCGDIDI